MAAAKERGRPMGRQRKIEGWPMWRGEKGGGERKRGCRCGGARGAAAKDIGAAAKERGAADGARREGRRRNQEGRPMGRGERG